jgi:hypothetical protein
MIVPIIYRCLEARQVLLHRSNNPVPPRAKFQNSDLWGFRSHAAHARDCLVTTVHDWHDDRTRKVLAPLLRSRRSGMTERSESRAQYFPENHTRLIFIVLAEEWFRPKNRGVQLAAFVVGDSPILAQKRSHCHKKNSACGSFHRAQTTREDAMLPIQTLTTRPSSHLAGCRRARLLAPDQMHSVD